MRIHWVPYEIYFTTTQINPGFYIYTLERSFCLIASIIINIRWDFAPTPVYIDLDEYTESSYDKHTITTEIRSFNHIVYYISIQLYK